MDIIYKRDGNQNYMVLKKQDSTEESYQEKMFLHANLQGLLTAGLRNLNGEGMYYYDIRSRQPLSVLFEHKLIDHGELHEILVGLSKIFHTLEEHLLSVQYLVLKPECIYMNPEGTAVSFCFYPGYEKDCKDSFLELSEFLLQRVDHSDDAAKELVYRYDASIAKGDYNPELLLKESILPENSKVTLEELLWENETSEAEDYYYMEEPQEEETESEGILLHKKKLIICGVLILLAAGGYLFALLNPTLLSFLGLSQKDYILAGAVIAALFGGLIFAVVKVLCYREQQDRKQQEQEENETKIQKDFSVDMVEEAEYMEKGTAVSECCEETTLLSEIPMPEKARFVGFGTEGKEIKLMVNQNPYIIGKLSGKADGIIEDTRISRVHAAVRKDAGKYYISDLNSTNGTFINDEQLMGTETYVLAHNDIVRFAGIELRFFEH